MLKIKSLLLHLECEIIHACIIATKGNKTKHSNYLSNKLSQKHMIDMYELGMCLLLKIKYIFDIEDVDILIMAHILIFQMLTLCEMTVDLFQSRQLNQKFMMYAFI